MPHSKLQLEVLGLYKQLLRAGQGKPGVVDSVKGEFRKNQHLARTDTLRIEYVLRLGKRRLEQIRDPNVSGFGSFK